MRTARLAAAVSLLLLAHLPAPAQAATSPLSDAFTKAATAFDVPADLLVAIAYTESRLDAHEGQPSASGGYGMMHLVSPGPLEKAAQLTGESADRVKTDTTANILGGSAVLASLAGQINRKDLAAWYPAVAAYSGAASDTVARLYTDAVYEVLNKGLTTPEVSITPSPVQPQRGELENARSFAQVISADYPAAHWIAASASNYTAGNRTSVDRVVIHVTQGSYAGAISWFQNPRSRVSAHYVVRSKDGDITQMVRHKDIGWHAGNSSYNRRSIGIEHEGFVNNASWFTDAMYRASAALTRAICDKYRIPKDRKHIIAHKEVPGADHTDPGPHWNWNRYMQLVNGTSTPDPGNPKPKPPGAWSAVIDTPTGSANWGSSDFSGQKYGKTYRFAKPAKTADAAWFTAKLPSDGKYKIDVWYPANKGYNTVAPHLVKGNTIEINQTVAGGSWQHLGTFAFTAGTQKVVGVSRWTTTPGYVVADAIRVTRVS
ncbi:N-acetylmuramoyl-L-alanine amidase [Nonomuraea soli]|uniref:N-acetylmuramoyl-L-alanine amidase n=1 Tax=Nonomuraea soli TaxID=1032476 RepID=A0A7W0HSU3_9ACTN|nr:N-acetylmuramoyl-L-alanine amidase [Nonomuraea soli]MBA2894026.1 hypothetical protein [Nonomuraea soli]